MQACHGYEPHPPADGAHPSAAVQAHAGRPRRAAGPAKTNLMGIGNGSAYSDAGPRPVRAQASLRHDEPLSVPRIDCRQRFHCIDCLKQPDGHGSAGPTPVRARASPRRRLRCLDCRLLIVGAFRTGPAGKPRPQSLACRAGQTQAPGRPAAHAVTSPSRRDRPCPKRW